MTAPYKINEYQQRNHQTPQPMRKFSERQVALVKSRMNMGSQKPPMVPLAIPVPTGTYVKKKVDLAQKVQSSGYKNLADMSQEEMLMKYGNPAVGPTYDQEPLGYGGVLNDKRPEMYSPVAQSELNPNVEAFTSLKVSPFKLTQNHRYYHTQSKEFSTPTDSSKRTGQSQKPNLMKKQQNIHQLKTYEAQGGSFPTHHQEEIMAAGNTKADRR